MRAVKGANTKPEISLRKALFAKGFRYRLHAKELPGKPDIVFPKYRAAIYVNGCFWHGHDCGRGKRKPKSNAKYWSDKIARNKARDEKNAAAMNALGWRTLTVWECELKNISQSAHAAAMWLLQTENKKPAKKGERL